MENVVLEHFNIVLNHQVSKSLKQNKIPSITGDFKDRLI